MLKLNKRGIMVDFLTTVLLAIIIFAPACYFLSKVFILSDQAVDSFNNFPDKIKEFANDENKAEDNYLLILDTGSAITSFTDDQGSKLYSRTVSSQLPTGPNREKVISSVSDYYLAFPADKCTNLPCLCLCRNANEVEVLDNKELSTTTSTFQDTLNYEKTVSCPLLTCSTLLKGLDLAPGFSIYRGEKNARRVLINMKKESGKIILSYSNYEQGMQDIAAPSNAYANENVAKTNEALQPAIAEFRTKYPNLNVDLASDFRTPEQQLGLYYDYCIKEGQKVECQVSVCDITAGKYGLAYTKEDFIFKNLPKANPNYCPHTKGYAVDVWCNAPGRKGFQSNPQCQYDLGKIMVANNFCRLISEPWHFEYLPLRGRADGSCTIDNNPLYYTYGKAHNPFEVSGCQMWDYDNHICVS